MLSDREGREADRREPVAARDLALLGGGAPQQERGDRREPGERDEQPGGAARTPPPARCRARSTRADDTAPKKLPMAKKGRASSAHRVAAAGVDQRARAAAHDDLHAGAEDEGAADHGEADRGMGAGQLRPWVASSGKAASATSADGDELRHQARRIALAGSSRRQGPAKPKRRPSSAMPKPRPISSSRP